MPENVLCNEKLVKYDEFCALKDCSTICLLWLHINTHCTIQVQEPDYRNLILVLPEF